MGNNFLKIIQDKKNKLFRGINLGDTVDSVIKKEGKDYYESKEVMTFLRYYFRINSTSDFEYKVLYYYDNEQRVEVISLTIELDKNLKNITAQEFNELTDDCYNYLNEKFGSPETKEKNVKGNGKEIHHSWQDCSNENKPIEIILTFWSNKKQGIEKGMKLEFQYFYE